MSIFNRIQGQVQTLYDSTCTITEFQPEAGIINNTRAVVVAENVPCRVRYKSTLAAMGSSAGTALTQGIKLYLNPNIAVKAGSSVTVITNGIKRAYMCAGQGAVYASHQEVELKLKDVWA